MDAVAPKNLKRKPSPKDPLHPTKAEFIRAKHVNLSFILKPSPQQIDENGGNSANLESELSKQLHASVRSANLETSLRLLVQGADPNYFNEVNIWLYLNSNLIINSDFDSLKIGKRLNTIAHGSEIGTSITN